MRILYAIQGTGNGHLSRATDIIPWLQMYGDVDLLVSGRNSDIQLPYSIDYKLSGLSFVFGKHGDIEFIKTLKQSNLTKLIREIINLPVKEYDLIVNDFEPVSAWAAKLRNIPCFGLSHQSAVASANSPKPEVKDLLGQLILRYYAPTKNHYGFHFEAYDRTISTPVIREEIRKSTITNKGHYTVYLPAYGDETLIKKLALFPSIQWEVFSKHSKESFQIENIKISPINTIRFTQSITSCEGVLCGAGFETPSEALFLKKKLLVVPMKSQYEQLCNAASLKQMGVPVMKNLKRKHLNILEQWLETDHHIEVNYPDLTEFVVYKMMAEYYSQFPKVPSIVYSNCNPTLTFP